MSPSSKRRSRASEGNRQLTGLQVVTSESKICLRDTLWTDPKSCMTSHSMSSPGNVSVLASSLTFLCFLFSHCLSSWTHWERKSIDLLSSIHVQSLTSSQSSLTLSLLRCILTEGTVYYDDIPTSSLNLDALRSNITIIPQVVSGFLGSPIELLTYRL
jgi:hypothetical protein